MITTSILNQNVTIIKFENELTYISLDSDNIQKTERFGKAAVQLHLEKSIVINYYAYWLKIRFLATNTTKYVRVFCHHCSQNLLNTMTQLIIEEQMTFLQPPFQIPRFTKSKRNYLQMKK